MKLLKTNKIVIYLSLGVFLFYSCSTNVNEIGNYKNAIFDELITETKEQKQRIKKEINQHLEQSNTTPNYIKTMSKMTELIDEIENYTLQNDSIKHENIIQFQNQLLFNFSSYRDGNKYWKLDTNTFDLTTCNPRDTITIRNSLQKHATLLSFENTNNKLIQLLLLQSNQYISEKWIGRYTFNYGGGCFDRPVPLVHFGNKVFFQYQPVTISPGMFLLENYIPIHILKQNSTNFIMENGKKKNFTNPITLKASATKGAHTVKGVIMIKQKGELIPKPFEFRYIVE